MDVNLDQVEVKDNAVAHKYEAHVGEHTAFIEYEREGDRITLISTEVPHELEGRGLAGKMAKVALDDARAHHLAVIPICSYIQTYIRRHQEYADLVPAEQREELLRG